MSFHGSFASDSSGKMSFTAGGETPGDDSALIQPNELLDPPEYDCANEEDRDAGGCMKKR